MTLPPEKSPGFSEAAGSAGAAGIDSTNSEDFAAVVSGSTADAPAAEVARRNAEFAHALVSSLAASGVRHVCLCPGSRSTPLVAALTANSEPRVWVHIDERSAAFFGLGLAKARREPVALLCTSGTAAANFFPAVIEASMSGVPLVVLTADRPSELRGWGAAQTIDQVRLYGGYVRWFAEAPARLAGEAGARFARALGRRAVAEATGTPPGPVHLNLPFCEPLEPALEPDEMCDGTPREREIADLDGLAASAAAAAGRAFDSLVQLISPSQQGANADMLHHGLTTRPAQNSRLVSETVEGFFEWVADRKRVVVACGPMDRGDALPRAICALARAAGWPVLADATSQLRTGPHIEDAPVLSAYDLFLRCRALAERLAPDLVVRVGAPLTSRAFESWFESYPDAKLLIVDPDGEWRDPQHRAAAWIAADPAALFAVAAQRWRVEPCGAGVPEWLAAWSGAETAAGRALAEVLAQEAWFEPALVRDLAAALPEAATLFVSNSMPVRDLDLCLPVSSKALRVLCNRGANGIDGIVSTALGAAAGSTGPLVLLSGDLALLHDLGGLFAAARHGLRATLVLINNDGGGIFSCLPIARWGERVGFLENFVVPHGLDFAPALASFGVDLVRVDGPAAFRTALEKSLAVPGVSAIEVKVDRGTSAAHHRRLVERVVAALELQAKGGF